MMMRLGTAQKEEFWEEERIFLIFRHNFGKE
jgi:hypothetical protein